MERRKLTGLRPQAYEHPLDTKALDTLQKTAAHVILWTTEVYSPM